MEEQPTSLALTSGKAINLGCINECEERVRSLGYVRDRYRKPTGGRFFIDPNNHRDDAIVIDCFQTNDNADPWNCGICRIGFGYDSRKSEEWQCGRVWEPRTRNY